MKRLFAVAVMVSFLSVGSLGFAGVDYIQYRDDFEAQKGETAHLQHKSKQVKDEMRSRPTSKTEQMKSQKTKTFQHKKYQQ